MSTPGDGRVELGLELAQAVLAAQPFSVHVGAKVTAFGDGAATLEIPVVPELLQQNGYVHGGVLAYAADNAITFAGGSVLGPEVLTGGMHIDYVAAAQGELLVAEATVVQASARRATCRCDVFAVDAAGARTLCAVAQGNVIAR